MPEPDTRQWTLRANVRGRPYRGYFETEHEAALQAARYRERPEWTDIEVVPGGPPPREEMSTGALIAVLIVGGLIAAAAIWPIIRSLDSFVAFVGVATWVVLGIWIEAKSRQERWPMYLWVAATVIFLVAGAIHRDENGGCVTEWDGRANPSVCED